MKYIYITVGLCLYVFIGIIVGIFNKIEEKKQREEQKRKEEEALRRERERLEKERQQKEQRKKEQNQVFQEKIKKEEANRSKGINYEICIVVYIISEFNALIRRSDNTFADVSRKSENATPYKLHEIIKLETEKIKNWNWFSEGIYQSKKEINEKEKRKIEERKRNLWEYNIHYLYHMTQKII